MRIAVIWDVTPCGSCENDVSKESVASMIRVEKICDMFLRNLGSYKSYTASHPRRRHSSLSQLQKPQISIPDIEKEWQKFVLLP
jgi:hypothetical protein